MIYENVDNDAVEALADLCMERLKEQRPRTELETWAIVRECIAEHPDAPVGIVEGVVLRRLHAARERRQARAERPVRQAVQKGEGRSGRGDDRRGSCRSCGAPILWKQKGGRWFPRDPGGGSHFETCPDADRWRGRRKRATAEASP